MNVINATAATTSWWRWQTEEVSTARVVAPAGTLHQRCDQATVSMTKLGATAEAHHAPWGDGEAIRERGGLQMANGTEFLCVICCTQQTA